MPQPHDPPPPTDADAPIDLAERRGRADSTSTWSMQIVGSDPPTYVLDVDGAQLRLTPDELANHRRFRTAYMVATRKVFPRMSGERHDDMIAALLERAETVDLPEESTRFGAIRDEVREILDDPPRADDRLDLLRNRVVDVDGRDTVTLRTVSRLLAERIDDKVPRHTIAEVMRGLGWEALPNAIRCGATKVRVWVRPQKVLEPCDG